MLRNINAESHGAIDYRPVRAIPNAALIPPRIKPVCKQRETGSLSIGIVISVTPTTHIRTGALVIFVSKSIRLALGAYIISNIGKRANRNNKRQRHR